MKLKPTTFIFLALAIIALGGLIAFWVVPYFFVPLTLPSMQGSGFGEGTARARVVQILDEGTIDLGGVTQPYQVVRVEVLEGEYQGVLMEMDYGRRQVRSGDLRMAVGDEIIVSLSKTPDGVVNAYFADFVRTRQLFWLALVFVVSIIALGGWKGFRSLVALAFSLAMIVGYILPHILAGEDPVRVSIIGASILLGVTLYLTYGWTLKTHASVLGMLTVLLLTGTLSWLFVVLTRLTGSGDEDALFLMQMTGMRIDLRGLILGGMLIGALGVLDDLVTTQSAAVFELHGANPVVGFRALVSKAMHIGQDHVAATVNTLVLAYAGGSLPMLLMFTLGGGNFGYLINFEFIAQEIVRTLVGSLGLIAAVPITTAIAAGLALYGDRLGALRPYLGSETGGDEGGHVH
jgi:uncharacterized membrane protein